MDELEHQLIRCFSSVFPNLSQEEIRTSGADFLAAWDSLTAVTLLAVLQEQFGLEIEPAELPQPATFQAVENYIREHKYVYGAKVGQE
jgi:acyl carrier protein